MPLHLAQIQIAVSIKAEHSLCGDRYISCLSRPEYNRKIICACGNIVT